MPRIVRIGLVLIIAFIPGYAFSQPILTGPDTLSFVLVAFSDVQGDSFTAETARYSYTQRHALNDFIHPLTSAGYYATLQPQDPASTPRAPNHEPVFGSLIDYFSEMSAGKYHLQTQILNPMDEHGYPLWVQMGNPKRHYAHLSFAQFIEDAVRAGARMGLVITPSRHHKICWIYAGNRWNSIPPQCDAIGGSMMRVHERWMYPYDCEHTNAPLTPVGMYCHEYAHLLGSEHHRTGAVSLWDLMGNGQKNASSGTFGNLPAPLDPWRRHLWGWLNFRRVRGDSLSWTEEEIASQPVILWEITPTLRFILDYRNFSTGFARSAPGGLLHSHPGLLLWHIAGPGTGERDVDLVEADTTEGEMNATGDLFRAGGTFVRQFSDKEGHACMLKVTCHDSSDPSPLFTFICRP